MTARKRFVRPKGSRVPESGVEIATSHLAARLEVLEARVAMAVARRRAARPPAVDDRFRGVFLSDAEVDSLLTMTGTVPTAPVGPQRGGDDLLARVEGAVDEAEAAGGPTRLRELQRRFGLSPLDVDLLITALAPDLDTRFERLYAYLQDDLTRRRPTIGLALELAGASAMAAEARAALMPDGRLVVCGLLDVREADRPFLSRTVRVPDRVTAHLLGDDTPDPEIEPYLAATVAWPGAGVDRLVEALHSGTRFFYAREQPGASGSALFGAALAAAGLRTVEVDLGVLAGGVAAADLVAAVLREVRLRGAGLVLNRADDLVRRDPHAARRFAEAPAVVCFVGRSSWDPDWARLLPYVVDVAPPAADTRAELWTAVLNGAAPGVAVEALAALRMRPVQMVQVVDWARRRATSERRDIGLADLADGARHLNSAALERLSTRVTPRAGWADLVLAPPVERTVRKVAARAKHRDLVQGTWGFAASSRRRGTIALFSGPPGTGKTLAAEVIAGELGIDLYIVNLATVVDKYIGETEKNLERVFQAAEEVNGLLFFDEADALFGRRSEVRDARDRYANIEVAYLLQRLERFDGIAILATNLTANLDEAFARRIDVSVEFRLPNAAQRRAIWRMSLPPGVPLEDDVELDFLAIAFALSGGSIRNICVEAAYLAASDGGAVRMEHVVRGAALEHRKLGHLLSAAEFKQHYELAMRELAT
jgi:hypothetical protein